LNYFYTVKNYVHTYGHKNQPIKYNTMKKIHYLLIVPVVLAVGLILAITSCDEEEERVTTTITLDKTQTGPHDIGETIAVTVTIEAEDVKSLVYKKVVDQVKGDAVDVTSSLSQSGKTFTYDFSYELIVGDDLATLGFEFEVTDDLDEMKTAAILVTTNLSIQGMFLKYDWKITGEDHDVWGNVLTDADAAKIFRFYEEDGTYTYEVDLSADHASHYHHFCYWVYKDTPSNGDTMAMVRLIRRQTSGETGLDEWYDFKITAANESEMTMYWDLAVFGLLNIKRTFNSQDKGPFQPYGSQAHADSVEMFDFLDCSNVDPNLLDF